MKTLAYIVIILISFNSLKTYSQSKNTLKYDDSEGSPLASLEEVSWLAGHWQGEALGGVTDDVWSLPLGNSMVGTFRLTVNNETKFYEIIAITEENGTLIKRLKHFTPTLKGWEEKDKTIDFKLVKITENRIYFDEFTYEKVNDDEFNIYIVLGDGKGNNEEVKFPYKRINTN